MSKILLIETATDVCSVSICQEGKSIALKEIREGRSHAVSLAVFLEELFKESGVAANQLNAVAISKGPGSYTGLRIGVSTAKGICYATGLPLISVNSLESMCAGLLMSDIATTNMQEQNTIYLPMIDARRMEVYTAHFNRGLECLKPTHAQVIDTDTYAELLSENHLVLFGSGADKLEGVLSHPNLRIIPGFKTSSQFMASIAQEQFEREEFENLAYFEPYYLKEFITTTPKKKLF